MTDLYGIFGYPVAHSRSPAMHNAAFAELGIDARYEAIEVPPAQLPQALQDALSRGVRGLNITLPHKSAIMALLDGVDGDAAAIGAVNTVVVVDGQTRGENTDAGGLARSLQASDVALKNARVTVLGNGGAVRAAVVGIGRAGARAITVAARRPDAAAELVEALSSLLPDTRLSVTSLSDEDGGLSAAMADSDLLVQGTSATLEGNPDAQAFADALPIDALPTTCTVTDLVYKPRITTVMARARARGLPVVDGSGMLLYQGALAFERWTGQPAPIEVMRGALSS